MIFAHDTEVALNAAAALVNTEEGPSDTDRLADRAALDDLVREWSWSGTRSHDEAELNAVRALRPRLRAFWRCAADAAEDEAVDLVNATLRATSALPQLVKHDQWDYHLHATTPQAPLDERMLVEAAMALVDVIRMKELARLRTCVGEGCGDVFVDLSKNRSRRFCDQTCGNRANVAAYRARRAARDAG